MCLITTKNIPKIAQEDIVCYKYYRFKKKDGKSELFSPYYKAPVPNLNEIVSTELDELPEPTDPSKDLYCIINKGFHSFKYLDDLTKELYFWPLFDVKIFKCIIPKGTKYYEGNYIDLPSYCSESIILKETIDV